MLPRSINPSFICSLLAIFLASTVLATAPPSYGNGQSSDPSLWSGWGGGILNNRWAKTNTKVNSETLKKLTYQCKLEYSNGVSATPTLAPNNMVYYPTWSGLMVALNYKTCQVKWTLNVTKIIHDYKPYTFQNFIIHDVSRTSPAINDGVLYFGTQLNALVIAANVETGKVLDMVNMNPNQYAIITMSPTWYNGKLLIGASSGEELSSNVAPNFTCCSFVGNMAALSFKNGKFKTEWNISMIPDTQVALGWTGSGLWGSQPMIDVKRNQVILGTSNTYSVPPIITDCQEQTANITAFKLGLVPDACLPNTILQDAIIAIDLDLGIINWVNQRYPVDSWVSACGIAGLTPKKPGICPGVPGDNAGFGMNPAFIPGSVNTPYGKDIVVVGQKSGYVCAMSAQTGHLFWTTYTSPLGVTGGLSWGVAADDERVYFTQINSQGKTWQLQPQNVTVNGSAWGAISLKDGQILWGTPLPQGQIAFGPPTVVGDVVLVGRGGGYIPTAINPKTTGGLVTLDRISGKVLIDKDVDGIFFGGIAVQDNYVLFGNGYSKLVVPGFQNLNTTGYFYVAKV